MRGTKSVAIGGLVLLLASCAADRLHYHRGINANAMRSRVVQEQPAQLIAHILHALRSNAISSLIFLGPDRRPRELTNADAQTWADYDIDLLRLMRQVLEYGEPGLEADVLVALSVPESHNVTTSRTYAVTVTWSLDNAIVVAAGKPWAAAHHRAPTVRELHDQFGIHAVASGVAPWTATERYALEAAFTRMPQSDLPLIRDIAFWRMTAPPEDHPTALALFGLKGERGLIQVFDRSATWATQRFCGDVNNPAPEQSWSILHEIGHALSQAGRARRLRGMRIIARNLDDTIATIRNLDVQLKTTADKQTRVQLTRKRDRLRTTRGNLMSAISTAVPALLFDHKFQDSTVSEAFSEVLPQHLAVTAYGTTQVEESFAEAYALFACDPAALERISVDAWAFFDSGRHLQLAELAIAEVDAEYDPLIGR